MKSRWLSLLLALCLCFGAASSMTACIDEHEHAYDTSAWDFDEAYHFYACACGDRTNVAAHTFVDSVCSVCGTYEPTEDVEPDGTRTVTLYDTEGRVQKKITYDANGTVILSCVCVYDDAGELLRTEEEFFYPEGGHTYTECDANGYILVWEDYDPDGELLCREVYEWLYDAQGNPNGYIIETEYADGSSYYDEFDKFGYCTLSISYTDGVEDYRCTTKNEYDEDDNFIGCTETFIYPDGSFTRRDYDGDYTVLRRYDYDCDGVLQTTSDFTNLEYDEDGNTCGGYYTETYADGSSIRYELDQDGNVELQIEYDENGEEYCRYETSYLYDEDGNYLGYKSVQSYADGSSMVSTFDENDLLTSEGCFDEDGELVWENVYTYDENGELTGTVLSEYDPIYGSTHYEYDGSDRLIRSIVYDADGNIERQNDLVYLTDEDGAYAGYTETVCYYLYGYCAYEEYDRYNNCTLRIEYIEDISDPTYRYEAEFVYDRDGNCISSCETETWEDGSVTYCEYDAYYNCTLMVEYDADGNETFRYEADYRYDEDGICVGSSFVNTYEDGSRTEWECDRYGNYVLYVEYLSDGEEFFRISDVNIFDEDGAYIGYTRTTLESDGARQVEVYSSTNVLVSYDYYDDEGNVYSTMDSLYDADGYYQGCIYTTYAEDGSYEVQKVDADQYIISKKCYDSDGTLWLEVTYEYQYDDEGNYLGSCERGKYDDGSSYYAELSDADYLELYIDYDADGKQTERSTYSYRYDENGDVIETRVDTVYANGTAVRTISSEDSTVEIFFGADGKECLHKVTTHRYDSEDTVIGFEIVETYPDGEYTVSITDADGVPLSENCYDADDTLVEKTVYHYDEDGNFTGSTVTEYFDDGYDVQTYDDCDVLTETEHYDAEDTLWARTVYSYVYDGEVLVSTTSVSTDVDGEIIRYTRDYINQSAVLYYYDADGSLLEEWFFWDAFDEDGNCIGMTAMVYFSDGCSHYLEIDEDDFCTLREEYDENGNLVAHKTYEKTYDESGAYSGYEVTEYFEDGSRLVSEMDENGKCFLATRYDFNDRETMIVVYDEDGNETERLDYVIYYDEDGTYLGKTARYYIDGVLCLYEEYDENDDTTKEVHYDENEQVEVTYETEFFYDEEGNFLRRTVWLKHVSGKSSYYEFDQYDYATLFREYDTSGALVQESAYTNRYDEDGVYTGRTRYTQYADKTSVCSLEDVFGYPINLTKYDQDKNEISYSEYFLTVEEPYGVLQGGYLYTYYPDDTYEYSLLGEKGRVTKTISYDADDNELKTLLYEVLCDDNGDTIGYSKSMLKQGKLLTYIEYDNDDRIHYAELYSDSGESVQLAFRLIYDDDGELVQINTYEYEADGSCVYHESSMGRDFYIQYDTDGEEVYRVLCLPRFDADKNQIGYTYDVLFADGQRLYAECDMTDNPIQHITYDSQGNMISRHTYTYTTDADGVRYMDSETILFADGRKEYYEYDLWEGVTKQCVYDADGNLILHIEDVNYWTEDGEYLGCDSTEYFADGSYTVSALTRDDVVTQSNEYAADGTLIRSTHNTYNQNDILTRKVIYEADGSYTVYVYDDQSGNLLSGTAYDASGAPAA